MNQRYQSDEQQGAYRYRSQAGGREDPQRSGQARWPQGGHETRSDAYGDYGEQRYRTERSWREDERDGPFPRDPRGARGSRHDEAGYRAYGTAESPRYRAWDSERLGGREGMRGLYDEPREDVGGRGLYGQYRSERVEDPLHGQEQYARGFGSGPGRFDRELGDLRGGGQYDSGDYTPEPYYGAERAEAGSRAGERGYDRGGGQGYGMLGGYDRGGGYDTGWQSGDWRGGREARQPYPGGAARFQRGPYHGRGPRNYSRSDERITEDLNERLTEDPYVDATDITVRVNDGVATLDGTVSERWMKYRAEDIVDACGGVKEVSNNLRVQSYLDAGAYAGSPGGTAERAETGSERQTPQSQPPQYTAASNRNGDATAGRSPDEKANNGKTGTSSAKRS